MSKKILGAGVCVAVIAALATGSVVKSATSSAPCVRPVSLMFFSESVPALQQLELAARDELLAIGAIEPGHSFNVVINPLRTEPTIISGGVQAGNGYSETIFGSGFLGFDVVYGFTATRSCDGGDWTFTLGRRYAKHKPADGYLANGKPKPKRSKAGGRPADPDR